MRLSTKGRYGTRAMLDIALHSDGGMVRIADVAGRQQVSKKYLEQVISRLEGVGVLRTVRGVGGGVSLARPASEITVLDILVAAEGSLRLADCVGHPELCARSSVCATRDIWCEMDGLMTGYLGSITLEDLCDRHRQKGAASAMSYSI